MDAQRMLSCDSPYQLFSVRIDVCYRYPADTRPVLGQVDHAEVAELRHGQAREVSERCFVVERGTENPTRLREKRKARARRFSFDTRRLCRGTAAPASARSDSTSARSDAASARAALSRAC